MLIFPWSSFFFGDLIKFVLEKLINNLLRSHHIFTFLSSELTVFSRGKEIMTGLESSCMGSSRERQDLSGVSWNWITGELQNETEGLIFATHDQALRANAVKARIENQNVPSKCRMCGSFDETVQLPQACADRI